MTRVDGVIIHCSDSYWGCATVIKGWHTAAPPLGRGWSDIGYGAVVGNGYWNERMYLEQKPWRFLDGAIEAGRPFDTDPVMTADEIGAHCYGWNGKTIGICLVGKHGQFTVSQLLALRDALVFHFLPTLKLSIGSVTGHYEHDRGKTCPDMDMNLFRAFLTDYHLIDDLVADQARRLQRKP